jgi:hypothetical protein
MFHNKNLKFKNNKNMNTDTLRRGFYCNYGEFGNVIPCVYDMKNNIFLLENREYSSKGSHTYFFKTKKEAEDQLLKYCKENISNLRESLRQHKLQVKKLETEIASCESYLLNEKMNSSQQDEVIGF